MFDHRHYVPILKTKAGEIWALTKLRPMWRPTITPLFELHAPKKKRDEPPKPLDVHVEDVCKAIKKAWGSSNRFFLDTEWINNLYGTAEALAMSLRTCRALGLKPIPVVRIDYDDRSLEVLKAAINADKNGCLLRLDFEDASAQAIRGVLEFLKLRKSEMHLLLDYRECPMDLAVQALSVPSIQQWATFTTASGAFPKTISTLPQKTWNELPRSDWSAWEKSILDSALPRRPTFSDYATRCPGKPAEGGDAHVHLRYTKERKWLVYLDGTLKSTDAPNMPSICRRMIAHSEYDGRSFSEGDTRIHGIAYQGEAAEEETGGPREWVQWCVNHHLTFVAKQIQSHDGF